MTITYFTTKPSPVGELLLVSDGEQFTGLYLDNEAKRPRIESDWRCDDRRFRRVEEQLDEFFAGDRMAFDLPFRMVGTDFQRSVWNELLRIPYGETATYAEIAASIGKPTAVRAVGAANGRNPLSIVVPCHRVVGSDGSLTGYAGGIERKQWLLDLESTLPSHGTCGESVHSRAKA